MSQAFAWLSYVHDHPPSTVEADAQLPLAKMSNIAKGSVGGGVAKIQDQVDRNTFGNDEK